MARRKKEEQQAPGIVVLYTSLMILLLAFFILLNSMSKTEEARVQAVFQSLVGTFGFSDAGASPMSSNMFDLSKSARAPVNPVDQDYLALKGLVQVEGLEGRVDLLRSGQVKTAVLPGALLFRPDSDAISPRGAAFLAQVAEVIADRAYPVTVRGHTDDAPSQRPGLDNWGVSGRRAVNVVRFLIARGVAADRLAAFGLAGFDPRVPNDTAQHRLMNNRVELVFDARDASPFLLPEGERGRKLDFRGFTFDLPGAGGE
jgi:chemotaxis protein MotB